MNIFVGNLAYGVTDRDLRAEFEAFGQVTSASVILDKITGKSRSFSFIEMPNQQKATAAIAGLNQKDIGGRPIRANEALPRESRPRREERSFDSSGSGGSSSRGGRGGSRDRF